MMMKSNATTGGGASPGAVKITLRTANDGVDEKAEVTVALNNPEDAVAKMLSTLAQRFPPESVMTISPARGLNSSEASSDVSGSRYTSSDIQTGVYLPPSLRDAMSTLPVEITSWILAADPNILPELLHLASRGGDAKVWAAQNGLAPEPVETVVSHMARDPELYDWVDKLAQASLRTKSTSPKHRKPKHHSGHRNRQAGSYQRVPVDARDPSRDILLVNPETGRVEGFESPSDPTHPVWLPTGTVSLTGARPSPVIPGAMLVPRDPRTSGDRHAFWIADPEGNVIGHVDRAGRAVLYPSSQRPQLRDPYARASSLPGITAVPVNPARPQSGNWLLDGTGRVVGHTAGNATVTHPAGKVPRPADAPAGVIAVSYRPEQPEAGSWLVDDEGNVVGHVDPDGIPVPHPPLEGSPVQLPYSYGGFPSSGLYGASSPVGAYSPQAFASQASTVVPSNLRSSGPWLVDPASGRAVGYLLSNGQAVMFPQRLARTDGQRPSGFPGLDIVPADPSRPDLGGPWIANELGEVVGHYDLATGKPVMHPPTGTAVDSVLPGLKTMPMTPTRPHEGAWLINPDGQIVGHTDEKGHPILYPQGGYPRGAGSPSGVPGVKIVPRDPKKPQDGGPWLVDEDGTIVGHYDSRGRPVLHPANLAPISEGGDSSRKAAILGTRSVPMDPSRPLDGSWLYDPRGNLVGHTSPTGEAISHPTDKFSAGLGKPSGIPGLRMVAGTTPWLIDQDGKVVGHHDPYGRVTMHPATSSGRASGHFGMTPRAVAQKLGHPTSTSPIDDRHPSSGMWFYDQDGNVVAHSDANGDMVMHQLTSTESRPSEISGINESPGNGLTWLVDDDGKIVGFIDPKQRRAMINAGRVSPQSPPGGNIPIDETRPRDGSYILDHDGAVVGHTKADSTVCLHPPGPFSWRPSGLRGVNSVLPVRRGDPTYLVDDDGNLIGHVDERTGRALIHPKPAGRKAATIPVDPAHPEYGSYICSPAGDILGHSTADGSVILHPTRAYSRQSGRPSRIPKFNEITETKGPHQGTWLINPQSGEVVGHVDQAGRPVIHPPKAAARVPIDPADPRAGEWLYDVDGRVIGHTAADGRMVAHPTEPFGRNAGHRSPVPGLNQISGFDQSSWLIDPQSGEVVGHLDESGHPVMHPASASSKQPIHARHPSRGNWLVGADGEIVAHTNPDGSLTVHPQGPLLGGRPSQAVPSLNEVPGADGTTWLVYPKGGDIAGFVDASGRPAVQPAKGSELPVDARRPEDGSWILDASGQIIGHTTPDGRKILHPAGHVSSGQTSRSPLPGIRTMAARERGDPTWLIDTNGQVSGFITPEGRVFVPPQPKAPRSGTAPIDPKKPRDGSFLFDADGNVVGHTDPHGAVHMHPTERFAPAEMQPVMPGVSRVPPRKSTDPTWLADNNGDVIGHLDPTSGNAILYPQKGPRAGSRRGTSFSSASYRMYDPQNMASNTMGGKSTWLTDPQGNVIGHLDANGNAVIHPLALRGTQMTPQVSPMNSPSHSRSPFQYNKHDPWLKDASGQVVGHYRPDGSVVVHPMKPFGPGAGSPSRAAPGYREVQSPRPEDPVWLVDAITGDPVGFIDRERGTPRFFVQDRGGSRSSRTSSNKAVVSPVPGLDVRPINPYRPGDGSWLLDPEGSVVGHTDGQNRPVMHPAGPLWSENRTPSDIPGLWRMPRDPRHPEHGGPWLVDAEGNVVGHFDDQGRPVLQPADGRTQTHRRSSAGLPQLPSRPLEPVDDRRPLQQHGSTAGLDGTWIMDPSTRRPIAYLDRPDSAPLYYPSEAFPPGSGTATELPGLRIMQRDPAHPERGGPWLVDDDGNLIGHFGSDAKPILFPGAAENLANLVRMPSSRVQPGYRETPVDAKKPEQGKYIIDPQTGEAIGHVLPNGMVVKYPVGRVSVSDAQPTGISGINRLHPDFSSPNRQISLIVDDQGKVIGHFAPNGRAYMHPAPAGRKGVCDGEKAKLESPVPGLGVIPRNPDRPGDGAWLISPESKVVGHTDAMNRPVMHPQQQFPVGSGETPTGIPGINVLPRDPSRPELGGPWLVDNDGHVIGHFAPDGVPILHKGPAYNSRAASPSNYPGLTCLLVEPGNPSGGKWLFDPAKDQVVGFVDNLGRSVMFPKEPLRSYQRFPELPGINLAPLNPSRPDLGGPWIIDDQGRVAAFYTPTGSLRLMPVGEHPEMFIFGSRQGSDLRPHEQVVYEPDGTRVRYVEVPVEREVIKEIPVKEVREIEKKITKPIIQEVEKTVEVEEIKYVDKIVEIEQIEEITKRIPKKEVIEVPREHVTYVTKEEVRVVEKVVEIPEIIEVPKPYTVENKVNVPRYINKEKHTMVAQRLRPIIREAGHSQKVEAKTYEPVLYPVDVFVPMPVKSSFIPMGKVDEVHNTVEVPAPQYNSLLKKMNQHLPPEATQDLHVRGVGGSIPLLPVGELVEIVPPVPSAFAQHARPGRREKSPKRHRRHGKSSHRRLSPKRKAHSSSRK